MRARPRDISTRGLYFVVDQNLESGSQLDHYPDPSRGGHAWFGGACPSPGQSSCVFERRMENGSARMGVAAVIERYDIIRGEAARA